MKGSDRRMSTADRVALVAIVAVSVLVITMLAHSGRANLQPYPAAASLALSPRVGMPMFRMDRRAPAAFVTNGRH